MGNVHVSQTRVLPEPLVVETGKGDTARRMVNLYNTVLFILSRANMKLKNLRVVKKSEEIDL